MADKPDHVVSYLKILCLNSLASHWSYFLLMIILYCHNIKYVLPYYINLYKDANDLSKFNSILLTWCVFMITCIKIWPICSINLWKNFIMIDTLVSSRCMFSTFILLAFEVHYTILMYLYQTKNQVSLMFNRSLMKNDIEWMPDNLFSGSRLEYV